MFLPDGLTDSTQLATGGALAWPRISVIAVPLGAFTAGPKQLKVPPKPPGSESPALMTTSVGVNTAGLKDPKTLWKLSSQTLAANELIESGASRVSFTAR